MQYFFLWLLSIPFLFLNYKIIIKDIKEKIIPNKYLLYLLYILPVYFIYIFLSFNIDINYLNLFLQLFFSIIISFLLYYFWIWWAWDAKYLLVLSFFLLHIWIIKFAWNIFILVLIYLFLYFLYFYLWKCLIIKNYAKSLYKKIYLDLKDKFLIFIKHNDWKVYKNTTIKIILNWFLFFLFIFIWFRLLRLIFIHDIFSNINTISILWDFIKKNQIFLPVLLFWIFWTIRYFFWKLIILFKNFILKIFKIKYDKTNLFFPVSLFIILLSFILFEYIKNPYELSNYLYKIFTFYIFLYIFIKILIYSYKLTFHVSETYFLEIEQLKSWEIIDRKYLIDLFWEQSCLGYQNKDWLLSPSPKQFFIDISNPIDNNDVEKIKTIFDIVDKYHTKNQTHNYEKIDTIKILMTFSFAPYIFWWFLLTIFFQNKIFYFMNNLFIEFIKNIYN